MIFEMGSNQFVSHFTNNNNLVLQVIEGPSSNENLEFPPNTHRVTIGRKQSNYWAFADDQHLSNAHAAIIFQDNKYYIEDLSTTNGTWRRLSL